MDIVARLRSVSGEQAPYANDLVHKWCLEAADEIERLRVAVAAERERWFRVTEAATTAAIVETREACARLIEGLPPNFGGLNRNDVASRIRAYTKCDASED